MELTRSRISTKIICLILSLAFLCGLLGLGHQLVFAADAYAETVTVSITGVTAAYKYVRIDVVFPDNTLGNNGKVFGSIGSSWVAYNSQLPAILANASSKASGATTGNATNGVARLAFGKSSNANVDAIQYNGELATLAIPIKADATEGTYPIYATVYDWYDSNGTQHGSTTGTALEAGFENAVVTLSKTSITVGEQTPPLPSTNGNSIPASSESHGVIWTYGGAVEATGNGAYTITPDAGYAIDEIWVDEQLYTADSPYAGSEDPYTYSGGPPTRSLVVTFAHTINFQQPDNGTLSVVRLSGNAVESGDIVYDGEILTVTVAVTTSGYELSGLPVFTGFDSDTLTDNGDGTYTATVLAKRGAATPSITASFVANNDDPEPDTVYNGDSYTATGFALYGGTITVSNTTGEFTVTATESGYVIDAIVVDGVPLENAQGKKSDTYTFPAETAGGAHSVVAAFAYTLNFQNPANGTLSVSRGSNTLTSGAIVRGGEELKITVSPDDGYELTENGVTVTMFDGNTVPVTAGGESNSYTFTVPGGPITVAAGLTLTTPAQPGHAITVPGVTEYGSVTADKSEPGAGETVTLTVTPANATTHVYMRVSVTGNSSGNTVVPVATGNAKNFTFTMPDEPVTVSLTAAEFAYPEVAVSGLLTLPLQDRQYTANQASPVLTCTMVTNNGLLYAEWYKGSSESGPFQTYKSSGTPLTIIPTVSGVGTSYYYCVGAYVNESTGTITVLKSNTAAVTVTSIMPQTEYDVRIAPANVGTVDVRPSRAKAGDTVTVTVTPESGFAFFENGVAYTGGESGSVVPITTEVLGDTYGVYSFEMPGETVTVSVSFFNIAEESDWIGEGTAASPYVISTAAGMRSLATAVNCGESFEGKHFKLTKSLDLGAWRSIGNYTNRLPFKGNFDGGGNSLTLNMVSEKWGVGLFGYVQGAEIKDVTVRGSVSGPTGQQYMDILYGAGVVGYADVGTVVKGCVNYADITVSDFVGGIVGYYQDAVSILDCVNYGEINGSGYFKRSYGGGIVGGTEQYGSSSLTIRNCVNHGDVTVAWNTAAGIVGYISGDIVISDCLNYGDILVTSGSYAGGIVGQNDYNAHFNSSVAIENCANNGSVSAWDSVGGIIGSFSNANALDTKNITITGCSNSGRIYGESANGGIVGVLGYDDPSVSGGRVTAAITGVYNTGNIAEKSYEQSLTSMGGIVGSISRANLTIAGAYSAGEITAVSENYVGSIIGARTLNPAITLTNCYYIPQYHETATGELAALSAVGADEATIATAVAQNDLANLAATLGDGWADDIGINDGYPILAWQADTTVHEVTTSLTAPPEANARLSVNGKTRASGERVNAAENSTVKYIVTVSKQHEISGWTSNGQPVTYTSVTEGADTVYEAALSVTGDLNVAVTVSKIATDTSKESPGAPDRNTATTVPKNYRWDGVTVDLTWFDPGTYESTSSYSIGASSELMGAAALVNGLVNENCVLYLWDGTTMTAAEWNRSEYVLNADGTTGGNNMSTNNYYYGKYDFNGKTILLTADVDMGATYSYGSWYGPNYMPLGGQYLMTDEDTRTKLSSSFCGTFDGGGHYVYNIYCDRHSSGNFGDGQSVGLIGRLGVHDSDPERLRPRNPAVKNVAITGYIRANRSVGGIVGKIGKTADSYAIIENCANFATIRNTDAKGVGGIVGAAWNGGIVRNCYNAGEVSSTYACPTGGIAGSNEITIENCYNIGTITAPSSYAMSIGTNNSGALYSTHVINCYYLADSAPSGGYYDRGSAYGADNGKTAQYMTSEAFVNDLNRNNRSAYLMDDNRINNGYPVLSWQGGREIPPEEKDEEPPKEDEKNETPAPGTTTIEKDTATTVVDEPIPLAETPTLVVINVETNGATVNTITAEVTAENVKAIAENGSSLEVRSDLGNVTLPNEAVKALSGSAEKKVDVKLTKTGADTYTLALTADDKAVQTVDGGVKLTIPSENVTPGTVAILVHADGTEEVIKKSAGKDGKISIPLDGSATIKIVDNSKAFDDVTADAWYSDGVKFTSSHELFQGTDDGGFAPEMSMTRGMLATVLHRLENAPSATGELFSDVAGDAYYAEAIIWASANSIVNGTGDGFAPDAEINREQLSVMLYRYADATGVTVTLIAELDRFPDADEVSDWAEEALKWAVAAGLIQGRDSGLAPKGTATRAEVAVILERFIENIL
jgi:hypothetical protein